jgi:hypothetical protein
MASSRSALVSNSARGRRVPVEFIGRVIDDVEERRGCGRDTGHDRRVNERRVIVVISGLAQAPLFVFPSLHVRVTPPQYRTLNMSSDAT